MKTLLRLSVAAIVVAALIPIKASATQSRDGVMESFDGAGIYWKLYLPDSASESNQVPVVLRTHGWGGNGERSAGGFTSTLLDNGYAVLTWDQRGFGFSEGEAQVDHPDWEVRDVQGLLTLAASQPEILTEPSCTEDGSSDPVAGMSGGSYAGGIQLMAASFDCRIDAIVPEIAWNDLPRTLFPHNVPKFGWDVLLYGVGLSALYNGLLPSDSSGTQNPHFPTTGNYAEEIHRAFVESTVTNSVPQWAHEWFAERSPKLYIDNITAPTFIIQGTVDTLFSINEGVANYLQIKDNAVDLPTKLMFFCSGHGVCSYPSGDQGARVPDRIVKWFDRHLKGLDVDTGPEIEYVTNDGVWRSASSWPVAETSVTASGEHTLVSTPAPTGGGAAIVGRPAAPDQGVGSARTVILTGGEGGTEITGIPRVNGTVSGSGLGSFLFFKLVNADTGDVLDEQVSAVRFDAGEGEATFDGAFDFDMEGVAYMLAQGQRLALEISTSSAMYSTYRTPAVVTVAFEVTVPTK